MIAIKRLQSIMWILVVAIGALMAYLVSLRVATERNAVASLDRQIYQARANIRYLEAEFGTRASLRQLETWNAQDIRYSVPSPDQYLAGETELASLDRIKPNGAAYVPPPVMTAMAQMTQTVPTVPTASEPQAAPAPAKPAAALAKAEAAPKADKPAKAASPALPAQTVRTPAPVRMAKAEPAARPASRIDEGRAARLALLDSKLLDDSTARKLTGRGTTLAFAER